MLYRLAVKIKCMPLQQELYRTYLLIQNIDPTARLSKLFCIRRKFLIIQSFFADMAKLLSDYQYLMKIWTVRYFDFLYVEYR